MNMLPGEKTRVLWLFAESGVCSAVESICTRESGLICFAQIASSSFAQSSTKMEESMWKSILKIQKVRRVASYFGFYCFFTGLVYAYTNNSTRAGISRADQFYSYFPAGTELLFDSTKLYKAALGNVFEEEEWGPVEFSIMLKHFQRQGKAPYAYHAQYMVHLLSNGVLDGTGSA